MSRHSDPGNDSSIQLPGKRRGIFSGLFFILLLISVALLYFLLHDDFARYRKVRNISDKIAASGHIIHAGGRVKGEDGKKYKYTNSLESLQRMYENGNRIVELDFSFTTDEKIVCMHKWEESCYTNETDQKDKDKEGHPISLNEFMSVKIYGYFTPIQLSDVIAFMREHEDVILITDIKESVNADGSPNNELYRLCSKLIGDAPDLRDRIVVQIYREDEYDMVRDLGFDAIIYTLYELEEDRQLDTAAHQKFAFRHLLVGYTFPVQLLKNSDFVAGMKKIHLPLFIHTVDKKEKIEKYLARDYISAVYTNRMVF